MIYFLLLDRKIRSPCYEDPDEIRSRGSTGELSTFCISPSSKLCISVWDTKRGSWWWLMSQPYTQNPIPRMPASLLFHGRCCPAFVSNKRGTSLVVALPTSPFPYARRDSCSQPASFCCPSYNNHTANANELLLSLGKWVKLLVGSFFNESWMQIRWAALKDLPNT